MLVSVLVFAASLIIMSAVVLPGRIPQRGTPDSHGAHGSDAPGADAVLPQGQAVVAESAKSSPASVALTALLVVILAVLVAAGFVQLSNM